MKRKVIIAISAAAIIIVGLFSGAYVYGISSQKNTILKGVYINDVYVGNLTKKKAIELLDTTLNQKVANKEIIVYYGDKNYSISYSELDAHYEIEDAVNKAFTYGKTGGIFKRLSSKWKMRTSTYNVDMEFVADKQPLKKKVTDIAGEINYDAMDATMKVNDGNIAYTDEKNGLKVDEEQLMWLLEQSVRPDDVEESVEVPVQEVEPAVKKEQLQQNYTQLSLYTTKFNPGLTNRTKNVRIATNAINNTVVMPGEIYSMNKTLGPRTSAKGYVDAPVIVGSTTTDALAGGICQVTSTIYNAAIIAGMEIVERSAHGIAVSYVPMGMDATISGDYLDFKFKNISQYPIYISSYTSNNILTVKIYGVNEHPDREIKVTSEITETIKPENEYVSDSTLPEGKEVVKQWGVTGYRSVTYKKTYKNGSLVSTDIISKDYYDSSNTIIRVGTKKVEEPPTPTPTPIPETTSTPSPTLTPTPTPDNSSSPAEGSGN